MEAIMDEERPTFSAWNVDRRTRFSKLAESHLEAFLAAIGGDAGLTSRDRLDLEDAALAAARLRILQEQEARGDGVDATDVAAAWHLARKTRATVDRIAKRLRVQRRGSR